MVVRDRKLCRKTLKYFPFFKSIHNSNNRSNILQLAPKHEYFILQNYATNLRSVSEYLNTCMIQKCMKLKFIS